ncbi:MAG TPA: protein kinase [Vicinamibacterales bacterium]|jgi:serine/threonine-protein kinase|nr:protein kinase [Vicinamibacterales bacterium]
MVGQTVGHYRIVEEIGRGGMGVVYRARDQRLDRDVAVKVLPAGTLTDERARRRFQQEGLALSKLNHPNIQTVHDYDTQGTIDFLVTEYVPGITLSDKLAGKGLPEKEVLRLGQQLADGLAAAHEQGIVHRDLKPGNLRLTPDGRLKILDFGVAKLIEPLSDTVATHTLTEAQTLVGTPLYMAPEQKLGEPVDARTDIYSAGLVLREMITGKHPRAPESSELAESSPRLQQILAKCLEKEPENRYQSAGELAVDLRRLSMPAAAPVAKGPRLQRTIAATAVTIALLIAGVLMELNVGGVRERLSRVVGMGAPRHIESLAVLPLENLSHDPEQEYFADGMTEAVIGDLAKIKAIKVFSRTSVMPYKNSTKPTREIARELQADALIEGSVTRSGDRVRITVQLIDTSSDRHLWAESYERDLKNVFALQNEVAQAIAQHVQVVITPQDQARFVKKSPVDPEVYELYLKGRHIMMRGGLDEVRKAIEYFQSGLAKDPNNALIYAGLADAYIQQMSDVHESPVEATAKARAATLKALELDESLAEAHTVLGTIKYSYDWDWTGAERELKRAMELNPGYSLAYVRYAVYLTIVGRQQEALPYFETARRLDPLHSWTYLGEGFTDFMARKYDESIDRYQKGLELEPDPMTYFGLVLARAEKGDYATAISEAEKATKLNDSPLLLTSLASAYALGGRRADSNRVLRQLEDIAKRQGPAPAWHGRGPSRYVCPYEVAGVYAQLGDKDRAFSWLDKAYQSRSCMYWLRLDPRLDSLHPDPRYQELLQRLNFPPQDGAPRSSITSRGGRTD